MGGDASRKHQNHEGSRLQASIFPMTAVRGRHPDDMNEGVPENYDAAHPSKAKHAFEWWYFDAHFTDGHTFAGTISNLKPQIYMQINTPAGEVLDIRAAHDSYEASSERCDVRCDESYCRGHYPRYEVHFYGEDAEVHLQFESLLPGWARGDGSLVFGSYGDPKDFGWLVAQPRAKVNGILKYGGKEYQVEGEGYHDHNWGDFSLEKYINRWHWGRITRPDFTVVFADVITNKLCGNVHLPLMLLARDDRLVFETYEMEWKYEDYRMDATGLQLYPRKVSFSFSEREVMGRFEFRPKDVFALDDMWKDAKVPGWLEGMLGKVLSQPVYFRLNADYDGEIDFGGDQMKVSGETIIEYMEFELRKGQVPDEEEYKHFLHPPKRVELHAEE